MVMRSMMSCDLARFVPPIGCAHYLKYGCRYMRSFDFTWHWGSSSSRYIRIEIS